MKIYKIILIVGILLCAALLTEAVLYSQNTLLLNGNWIVKKRMLNVTLMGADEFLITRSPLAKNSLNLGAWYGFQEVLLKESCSPKEINFKFEIPDNSYLDISFDRNENNYYGIRLSRNEDFSSIYFKSNPDGGFVSSKNITVPRLDSGWHLARLSSSELGLSLKIDAQEPLLVSNSQLSGGQVGFRAGRGGARLDNLRLTNADGRILEDSFRNSKNQNLIYFVHLIILFLFFSLLSWFLIKKKWSPLRIVKFNVFVTFQLAICLLLLVSFDFFYWSQLPFQPHMRQMQSQLAVPQLAIEKIRFGIFDGWGQFFGLKQDIWGKLIEDKYPIKRVALGPIYCNTSDKENCKPDASLQIPEFLRTEKKPCYRIIFFGTSQTRGVGAEYLAETFFVRLHHELSRSLLPACLISINMSVSGANLPLLQQDFKNNFTNFNADLMLVNLSNNDVGPNFSENLSHLLTLNKSLGIRTVFVEEPNSTEYSDIRLLTNHSMMSAVAKQHGVPLLHLYSFLSQPEIKASGAIWWDYVHLSSYGQLLTAKWLAPQLLDILKKQGPRAKKVKAIN